MRKCSNQFSSLQKWGKVWYEEVCNKALWLSVVFLWRFPVCCCLHVCHRVYLSSRPPQWHLSKKTMLPWLTQTFTFKAKEVSASVTLFLQCCMPHSKEKESDVLNSSLKKSIYILGTRAKGKTAHLRNLHIQSPQYSLFTAIDPSWAFVGPFSLFWFQNDNKAHTRQSESDLLKLESDTLPPSFWTSQLCQAKLPFLTHLVCQWLTASDKLTSQLHTCCVRERVCVCMNYALLPSHSVCICCNSERSWWERLARLEEHVILSWPFASSCGAVSVCRGIGAGMQKRSQGDPRAHHIVNQNPNCASLDSCHCKDSHTTL